MIRYILIFIVINIISSEAYALGVIEGAPEGFEQLDAPRATSVNLYYGGELVGPVPAHFFPGNLQFDQPETIIAAIPGIKDKEKIKEILSKPLPANADLLCTEKKKELCGKLEPEIAGIIFNENRLEVEIFVNKNYLSVIKNELIYLPSPTATRLSSVYGFNGAVNGSGTSESPNFTLSNNAVHSIGAFKLNTQSTISDTGLRFDTLSAGTDKKGFATEAGLFRSRAMQLVGDRDMAGVSVGTSTKTLVDNHKTEGNDVIVYLARRAFVSIYREGRLYSSRTYEAGNQKIDTSELPEGSYTITLKIQESDGTSREETRFFAKSQELPPLAQPAYYLQAGVLRKSAANDSTVPELTEKPLLRFGTIRRLNENMALSAGFLGLDDRLIMEDGIFWLNRGHRISAEIMASSAADYGFHLGYLASMERWNASLDFRKIWSSNETKGYDSLLSELTQASLSFGYSFGSDINLGLRADYSLQKSTPHTASVGPYMEWRMWQEGENTLNLSANAAHNERGNEGSFIINFIHRFGNFGLSSTANINAGDNSKGIGSMRVWHDNNKPGDNLLVGAGVTAEKENKTVNADADWKNHVGQLHGSVQDSFGKEGSTVGYGGSFSINAAQIDGTELHFGGNQNDQSAVIVETEGDADAEMKIYVGGTQKSSVKIGDNQAIYLTPFHSYNIRVAPVKSALLDYDGGERKVTLYPGNVVKLKWSINKFYVVTGRVVDENGKPLANALLQETKEQVVTDEDGHIQAEMSKPEFLSFLYGENNALKCRAKLDKDIKPVNGVLIYRTPITCIKEKD